jgi:outer membrane protein with beta-barrel domain
MSAIRSAVLGAVLMASVGAAPAVAQGAEFSLGGGLTLPLGNFDDFAKLGWHGIGAVSFVPQDLPVGFQVDGSFSRLSDESPADIKSQLIYGTGNVIYKFKVAEETKFRPYLIGGGGVYNLDSKGDDVPSGVESVTKFGINAGAGFDFKAGAAGVFVEGRFHNVFTEGSNTNFIPFTVGVRFGGT